MYHFNIILTELCNANCSHCYMSSSSSKKRKTLTKEQIITIISKLPENTATVTLTGGEVFLVGDLLDYTIKLIKNKLPNTKIEIESNGIYLYKNNVKDILEYLKKIGVNSIRFSLDPFHSDGGVDLNKVRDLKEYQTSDTPIIRFLIQEQALAIGKAEELSKDKTTKMNCMNTKKTLNEPYLFLDIDGYIYPCAWKCVPPLGNIFADDFNEIENKMKDKFNTLLLCGQIEKAVSINSDLDINSLKTISKENGQCYLCIKKYWNN